MKIEGVKGEGGEGHEDKKEHVAMGEGYERQEDKKEYVVKGEGDEGHTHRLLPPPLPRVFACLGGCWESERESE